MGTLPHRSNSRGQLDGQSMLTRIAERAQSISPQRSNPTDSPPRLRSTTTANAFMTPPILSPSVSPVTMDGTAAPGPPSPTKDIPEFKGFGSVRSSTSPSASSAAPASDRNSQPSPSATSLARSGTLSWQRRPASRGGGGSRPTSLAGGEGVGHARNISVDQPEQSREQIAASLATRDPAWFRQTSDRGTGSAALRKTEDEVAVGD